MKTLKELVELLNIKPHNVELETGYGVLKNSRGCTFVHIDSDNTYITMSMPSKTPHDWEMIVMVKS